MTYDFTIGSEAFKHIKQGRRTFDIRPDADSKLKTGDEILYREWTPTKGLTGKMMMRRINHVCRDQDLGLQPGHAVIGIEPF